MSKSKLEQVLEYLVAGNEEQAKELLHKVFIEKARAIHEELIGEDEMEEETLGGDEGAQLRHQVKHHDGHIEELSNEIEAEEVMGEDEDMDLTMDMDSDADMSDDIADEMGGDDESAEGDVMGDIEDTMGDLETALAELKAEFERLEAEHGGSEDAGEEMMDMDSEEDSEESDEELAEAKDEEEEEEEEELDEQFTDEDFADLAEAIELEKVAVPHSGEVGSGKFSPKDADAKSKSPVPPSQTERFGAKPIKTGAGPHASGYAMQTPPSSEKTKILPKDNRRKTEFQDTENEQSGNYGAKEDSKSALDTTDKTFGKGNQTSPLTHAPRK